jgi:hypothetical protein
MGTWRILPNERTELYSPIGLRLVDGFTGLAPIGWVRPSLDVSEGGGSWRSTEIKGVITQSSVVIYPGLERRAVVVGQPARRYRVRVEAELYRPWYQLTSGGTLDGIEFDAFPYNDADPPQKIAVSTLDLNLVPAAYYPFPTHVLILRGIVAAHSGSAVVDAEVNWNNKERVLTDERGEFGLPLRLTQNNERTDPQNIDATDHRTGRTGSIVIQLPHALRTSQRITIS